MELENALTIVLQHAKRRTQEACDGHNNATESRDIDFWNGELEDHSNMVAWLLDELEELATLKSEGA